VGLAIFGIRLGQAYAWQTHAWGEVLSVGAAPFFNSAIFLSCSELSPPRLAEQRMGLIVHGSDCHSQRLDQLLLRGQTEQYGGGQPV
jgi:hypothetical protein